MKKKQSKKEAAAPVVSIEKYRECHNQKCKTSEEKRLSIIERLIDSDYDLEVLTVILTMLDKAGVIITVFIIELFI